MVLETLPISAWRPHFGDGRSNRASLRYIQYFLSLLNFGELKVTYLEVWLPLGGFYISFAK